MSTKSNSPFVDDPLSAVDARVLGSLVEKRAITPEIYLLTPNALVLACNRKTGRDPVMNLTPGQAGQSLHQLEGRGLIRLVVGSRINHWGHTPGRSLELVAPQVTLLGLLFLRGLQVLDELLIRGNRPHDSNDIERIRHHLERLAGRNLTMHLECHAGQREERHIHLLSSQAGLKAAVEAIGSDPKHAAPAVLSVGAEARIAGLETCLAALEERLTRPEGGAQYRGRAQSVTCRSRRITMDGYPPYGPQ